MHCPYANAVVQPSVQHYSCYIAWKIKVHTWCRYWHLCINAPMWREKRWLQGICDPPSYLCTGFQSMHAAKWQASSIPTYNMDGVEWSHMAYSHNVILTKIPNPKWSEGAWQSQEPQFYKQLSPEDPFLFIYFFILFYYFFLRAFFPRDLNFRKFSLKDPNLP